MLILTGRRAGEREWRSRRDWESPPTAAPDLPRFELVPDPIPFCPITQALSVFRECYPEVALVPVLWDPHHDTPGACYYRDNQPAAILLDPALPLGQTVGVLVHELAHVVVTPQLEREDHGPLFGSAEARLRNAYEERSRQKLRIPGTTWIKEQPREPDTP